MPYTTRTLLKKIVLPLALVCQSSLTWSGAAAPEQADVAPNKGTNGDTYALAPSFSKLPSLAGIVELIQAPNDSDTWYAVIRDGLVLKFANKANAKNVETVVDLRKRIETNSEMGLLSAAFHPEFAENGFIFLHYNNKPKDGESTISRFKMAKDGGAIDPKSEKVILTQEQPAANHNGGSIVFGPDGYLYIGFGDGGRWNDQFENGQNPQTWLGTILRIDVNTEEQAYTIPADNPFRNKPNFRPEIYAWGSRNPWRFSFDMANGRLWLGDVGQDATEEVHIVNSGDNLGWPIMEGTACFQGKPCNKEGLNIPVAEYHHSNQSNDCSVTGGFVYRGKALPTLQGYYIYGDFCSGRIRTTAQDDAQWISQVLLTSGKQITSFAQDAAGEIYALDFAGDAGRNIFHLEAKNKESK